MALFLRNARLIRNQRLCLQVQQVFRYCDVAVIAAKQPFQVELIEGKKYSWCKCGLSKKQVETLKSYALEPEAYRLLLEHNTDSNRGKHFNLVDPVSNTPIMLITREEIFVSVSTRLENCHSVMEATR